MQNLRTNMMTTLNNSADGNYVQIHYMKIETSYLMHKISVGQNVNTVIPILDCLYHTSGGKKYLKVMYLEFKM